MKVGLSQRILMHKNRMHDSLDHSWYSFLSKHFIKPVANLPKQDFDRLADDLDLYIITGGDDSTPRRISEIRLALAMMKRQKPIVGVCHGAFLLTDILGGKVVEIDGHLDVMHEVNYFGEIIEVNSHHNLAIKIPHKNATVLVNDSEGNCESWIDGNLAGVVWHPERMETAWIPEEIQAFLGK